MIQIENTGFIFDGVKSSDMGIYIVRVGESGVVDTPFFGGQDLITESVSRYGENYLYRTQMQPIEFTFLISLLDEDWTPHRRGKIAKWLIGSEFKPFQTTDDMGKYYYATCTEFPSISVTNGKGYGEITFTTNAPYAWTSKRVDYFDLSKNTTKQIIETRNDGNYFDYYEPQIEIEVVDGTSFKLVNLSDGGREFEFTGLSKGEIISVDNKNKFIKTSLPLAYRYENFNKKWLRLLQGVNRIEVTGKVRIKIKAQYPIIR